MLGGEAFGGEQHGQVVAAADRHAADDDHGQEQKRHGARGKIAVDVAFPYAFKLLGALLLLAFHRLRASLVGGKAHVARVVSQQSEYGHADNQGQHRFCPECGLQVESADERHRRIWDDDGRHARAHCGDAGHGGHVRPEPPIDQHGRGDHAAEAVTQARQRRGAAQHAEVAAGERVQRKPGTDAQRCQKRADAAIDQVIVASDHQHGQKRHERAYRHDDRPTRMPDARQTDQVGLVYGKRRGGQAHVCEQYQEAAHGNHGLVMLLDLGE